MASTYSALKIELIGTGEQSGTWGATTNVNVGDAALGEAITGSADVAFSSAADVTVTLTDTNTSQTARNLRLNITESGAGIGYVGNLVLGSGCQIEKLYLVNNGTTGAKTIKNTSGTGISVPAGKSMFVFNNGTNVVDAVTYLSSLATPSATITGGTITGITDLAVADGGTGASTLSANAVLLGNGTSALQTVAPGTNGNVLTSNGTTWTSATSTASIPTGSVVLFYQAAAPTGWTQVTALNDYALRLVSGTGGTTGGTTAFSTIFSATGPTTGATTLSTAQIPSHDHTWSIYTGSCGSSTPQALGGGAGSPTAYTTGATGGGGSHTHSGGNMNVHYANIIICSKN